MKKILFLTSALIMSTMLFAEATTVDIMEAAGLSAPVTLNDDNNPYQIGTTPITLTGTKGDNNFPAINYNANKGTDLRFYKGTTCSVTFEADGNTITKIEFLKNESTASAMGSEFSVNVGTLTENVWEGEATAVTFFYSHTENFKEQAYIINVTYTDEEGEGGEGEGGEGEGGEGQGGEIVISDLYYVDAVFYEDETYGDYWSFDFYKDLDEEGYILAPYVYFICNESTTSSTKIAGTWSAYEAGYYETDDPNTGIYTDEEVPVGSLTVTCVGEGLYNFAGSFVGEDGKTYKWNLNNMEVYAYNGDTYEDISLDDYQPTAVENTEANVQSAIKTLRNGQVLIRKNNKVYTILGQEVK